MNSTRCKLQCIDVKDASRREHKVVVVTLEMYAPSGRLEVEISDPDAIALFEIGRAYHVDISRASD